MDGAKPISYKYLKQKIKKHMPELYRGLCLDMYNPWEDSCCVTKEHYILVHSAIEFLIKK